MKKTKALRRWIIIVGLIFLAVLYRLELPYFAARISSYIVYPVIYIQSNCVRPIKNWFEKKKATAELEALVVQYQQQAHQLLEEIVALRSLNCIAQETADIRSAYNNEGRIAQVLVRQFGNRHFFLVDRGEKDGINIDMIAVYKNCLIGRVVEVYPWYSKVLLITDTQCKVPVMTATNKARGIYSGMHAYGAVNYVSHLAKIEEGELIITSGEGLVFPKGFGLGKIKNFTINDADYTYNISIEPLIDIKSLEYCTILKKGNEATIQ